MRTAIAAALLVLGATQAPAAEAWRFRPTSGEYSIDMREPDNEGFHPGKEVRTGDILLVDFWFEAGQIHGGIKQRTVEWLKAAVPPEQSDRIVSTIVSSYLDGRFGAGKFTIADRRKSRDGEGRLNYLFAAKGVAGDIPAGWQGSVYVFDGAVALVSEVLSLNMDGHTNAFDERDAVFDRALIRWAETIRPEPPPG